MLAPSSCRYISPLMWVNGHLVVQATSNFFMISLGMGGGDDRPFVNTITDDIYCC